MKNKDFEKINVKEEPNDDNLDTWLQLQIEENVAQVDQNMDKDDDIRWQDDNSNVRKADLRIK